MSASASFFSKEPVPGIILLFAAILALVCANTGLDRAYHDIIHFQILGWPLHMWVNDALMAIFFLLVGLEMKKELFIGELSSRKTAMLPLIGALGGMALPAAIYFSLNYSDPATVRGWAIPAATDIAFAVGVLSLFGNRIPGSLKIFLLALAVIDDMGAVLIIALFYTATLNLPALAMAALCGLIVYLIGRFRISRLTPYILVGFLLWYFVVLSGVHATIAGVTLGLLIPLRVNNRRGAPLCTSLEHVLKPWVNYLIMPIFAFFNAGVSLSGLSVESFKQPVTLGILIGLFAGKQLGIFSFVWTAIKLRWCDRPQESTWPQLYGVCIIAGIGFTMSLFIGLLAFSDELLLNEVKLGVLSGSLLSAVVGYVALSCALKRK